MMGQIRREILQAPFASNDELPSSSGAGCPSWHWGTPVHFRKGDRWGRLLVSGWSYPEAELTWSDGPQAIIEIEAPPARRDLLLRLSLSPFCPPGVAEQTIRISDQHRLIALGVVPEPGEHTYLIPGASAANGVLRLSLKFPAAISPYQAGLSDDHRILAIGLKTLTGYLL
jgi:hypothetical protein